MSPLNLALLKNCSLIGVFWLAFTRNERENSKRNNNELTELFLSGKVAPHLHSSYPLERAAEALNEVISQPSVGKVVLVP